MVVAKKVDKAAEIRITPLYSAVIKLRIIGQTPLFVNRVSEKAKRELLMPKRKSIATRAGLKHDPIAEFKAALHMHPDKNSPTLLALPSIAFKAALCDAALETDGVHKTTAQRLLFLPEQHVALYGLPRLRMDITRNSDMQRTPDVRSRPYLEKWGFEVEVHAVQPQLPPHAVYTLACNAGQVIGIGDFRQQKGKGNYGTFKVSLADDAADAEWDELVAGGGRVAQALSLENVECADDDTEELFDWYREEYLKRAA